MFVLFVLLCGYGCKTERVLGLDGDSDLALGSIGHLFALSGDKAAAKGILAKVREMAQSKYISLTASLDHSRQRPSSSRHAWL